MEPVKHTVALLGCLYVSSITQAPSPWHLAHVYYNPVTPLSPTLTFIRGNGKAVLYL